MKKKCEIFILEDSDDQRYCLAMNLKQIDRKLIFAESIQKAKSIFNSNATDIDLFIIDLGLPDGNGLDFLQYVRESSNVSPAIITSAAITDKIREDAEKLGIVALFDKPIKIYELNQTINEFNPIKNYDTTQDEKLGSEMVILKTLFKNKLFINQLTSKSSEQNQCSSLFANKQTVEM